MTRSLAHGDYSLLMAVESASRPDRWYRVLADRQTGALSCDCPPWVFNQDERSCNHTEVGARLVRDAANYTPRPLRVPAADAVLSPLIDATHRQWPGLGGIWSIEERIAPVRNNSFHFVLLRLATGNGGIATGVVAFAERHHHDQAYMEGRVAGWAGYAIAAEVARLGGFPMAGQPPDHFRVDRRATTGRRARPAAAPTPVIPRIGLADILRVGDHMDQGDGLRPEQRAEATLLLFLGETLYGQLERQHFLDVPSVHYAAAQRVYRLRRDPAKRQERRVRVFEGGTYASDYCIIRGQDVPEGDHFLTCMLMFLSDERAALSVVGPHNVFRPYSDGQERETIPVQWQGRGASLS